MEPNQKVNITGGDYKNYSGKIINRVSMIEWTVKVNLGGGRVTRAAIDERYLSIIPEKKIRTPQVRGRGGLTVQNRLNAY